MMTDNHNWIKELGQEWTAQQQQAQDEKRLRVDEERPRREARELFWSDFRAAVEQITGDFNAAVGQPLVELSANQKSVSSLGIRAGDARMSVSLDSTSKFRVEKRGRLGGAGKRVFDITYADGQISLVDLPAGAGNVARQFLQPWLESVVRGR